MKVAVVYWTGTGNTEAMAKAVVEGVKESGNEAQEFGTEFNNVSEFDAFAFGCPAMGDEVLEEGEFEPMFASVENELSGKKVLLFGSFGWGDGKWMRDWYDRCKEKEIEVVNEGIISQEAPDADKLNELKEAAKLLVA